MIEILPVTKENWEEAILLSDGDATFVSVAEGIAAAYVKPWDEALDPYVITKDEKIVGFIYVSYTPMSIDNYWIGGLYIHPRMRNQGIGKKSILKFMELIKKQNPSCEGIRLTVDDTNIIAKSMYENLGFITEGEKNKYGEVRYYLALNQMKNSL